MFQNKQTLKRFTYICLSLSSILLSSEVQAGGCFSKSSSDDEENNSKKYKPLRLCPRPQKEKGEEEGLLFSVTKLRQQMETRNKKLDNLFDKILGATVNIVAPKMKEEDKNSLVKAIEDFIED